MAQQESISRKVIASVIATLIAAALLFLAKLFLPGLLSLVATFFLTIWHWCIHLVSVPVWLLIVLLVYVGVSLIRAYFRHRKSRTSPQSTQSAQRTPDWTDYKCDVFDAITWRWNYGNGDQPVQLLPFCFKCDTQIHPGIGHIDAVGEKTNYVCDHCANQVRLIGSHDYVVDRISRQIQRKLRSQGEEWKVAIKANAWKNP